MSKHSEIGIIFDCDGTLLDSMSVWHSVDDMLASLVGGNITQADRDYMTAATIDECGEYLHSKFHIGDGPQDIVRMIDDHMYSFYTTQVRPKPGALRFVQGLADLGIPMSVASSTPPKLLEAGLEHADMAHFMKAIVSVDDVNSSKREPLVYDVARKPLGTSRERTWGFEDAVYAIKTLKRAGYRTFAVYDSEIAGSPERLKAEADGFIMSFEDITAEDFVKKFA